MKKSYTDAELRMLSDEELERATQQAAQEHRELYNQFETAFSAAYHARVNDEYDQSSEEMLDAEAEAFHEANENTEKPMELLADLIDRFECEFERRAKLSSHERLAEYEMRRVTE